MERQFKFLVPVAKAGVDDGALIVEGVASDTGLDLYHERISLAGQESMAAWARTGMVALGGEADHFRIAFDDDLGYITDGRVLDSGAFYIRAELDVDNPRAVGLHTQLRKGKQLGLSVFGVVTESHTDANTPVIDGVRLDRVMVTPAPANPRTWLESVAKSLLPEDDESEADSDNDATRIADDAVEDNAGGIEPEPEPEPESVRVARSFGDAAAMLMADESLDAEARRGAMMERLAETAKALDDALPPETETEDVPPWVAGIVERLGALEKALADVHAASRGTQAEAVNSPVAHVPVRKSQPPDVRASSVVQKARTFQDVVSQLTGSDLRLP